MHLSQSTQIQKSQPAKNAKPKKQTSINYIAPKFGLTPPTYKQLRSCN
jgi:hypothetical protein